MHSSKSALVIFRASPSFHDHEAFRIFIHFGDGLGVKDRRRENERADTDSEIRPSVMAQDAVLTTTISDETKRTIVT